MALIALFMENAQNRRLLTDYLSQRYELTYPDSLNNGIGNPTVNEMMDNPFDLCVVDGVALTHLWKQIQAKKQQEQPVILPVLLITVRPDVSLLTRNLWESVDELITKPLEKRELQARIEMLLRSRRLSLELKEALQRERELNQLKSRFLSMASHEFRSPMNMISGYAGLLEKQADMAQAQKVQYLKRIQKAVSSVVKMLDDLLALNKSEISSEPLNPVPVELPQFCRSIIEEVSYSVNPSRSIQLDIDGECDRIYLDKALLRQILANLLSNALKYSPPETPVMLTVRPSPDAVILEIKDNGIGISAEDQKQLFDSFYRASNVGNAPGTGLGLSIVKQAVDHHGGQISFDSQLEKGTRFTVELPNATPGDWTD